MPKKQKQPTEAQQLVSKAKKMQESVSDSSIYESILDREDAEIRQRIQQRFSQI